MEIIRRLGSLELATVIFWMLFWGANGLGKFLPGVHIGVKFGDPGGHPFGGALEAIGWPSGLGDFALIVTAVVELLVGLIFLWALIQIIMGSSSAARRSWILFGLFISAIIFAVFTFQNIVAGPGVGRPTPLIWHTTYFAVVGVSWLVIVGQGVWEQLNSDD